MGKTFLLHVVGLSQLNLHVKVTCRRHFPGEGASPRRGTTHEGHFLVGWERPHNRFQSPQWETVSPLECGKITPSSLLFALAIIALDTPYLQSVEEMFAACFNNVLLVPAKHGGALECTWDGPQQRSVPAFLWPRHQYSLPVWEGKHSNDVYEVNEASVWLWMYGNRNCSSCKGSLWGINSSFVISSSM